MPTTALHPTGVSGRPWGSFAGKSAATLSWTAIGALMLYAKASWRRSHQVYLEATMRSSTGTSQIRLYDVTAAAAVTGSAISTSSSTMTRVRSSALTLTDGNEYRVQVGEDSAAAGHILSARVIIT